MSLFTRKPAVEWTKPFSEKLASRVARIQTSDLESWADQALFDIGRCLTQYGKNRDVADLEDALIGAEALHAVVNDLVDRKFR